MKLVRIRNLPVAVLFLIACASPNAQVFNIDFGSANGVPSSSYGGATGQTGFWNKLDLLGLSAQLVDVTGVTTSVRLSLSAGTITGSYGSGSGDISLLNDSNFYSSEGSPWSFTLSGLVNGNYDVYYFAPSHPSVDTGSFTINGLSASSITGSTDAVLQFGVDYASMLNVPVTDGTLNFVSTSLVSYRGLSGLQFAPTGLAVPEPSTGVMVVLGAVLTGGLARRRSIRYRRSNSSSA